MINVPPDLTQEGHMTGLPIGTREEPRLLAIETVSMISSWSTKRDEI